MYKLFPIRMKKRWGSWKTCMYERVDWQDGTWSFFLWIGPLHITMGEDD